LLRGGGGTCTFTKATMWKSLSSPFKRLVSTAAGRAKDMQGKNEAHWAMVTGRSLLTVPLPDMLRLHFPNGAPCPEELVLVQTCDCVDYAGQVHRGMEFAFNLLHVARQTIVAACEAQTLADEVRSSCPLPFAILNPVTQVQFDEADLNTFNEAFAAGFRALKPADLKSVASTISTHLANAGWALYVGSLVASATASADSDTSLNEFVTGASNAFFLASGAVGLVSSFSAKDLADFAVYQSTVYAAVPSKVWYAYQVPGLYDSGQRLLATLRSQWKSHVQKQAAEKDAGGQAGPNQTWARFDVRVALEIDAVERARVAEMAFDEPPVYNSATLDKIQRHCAQLRTTCSAKKLV
jgi:hypothetical protein